MKRVPGETELYVGVDEHAGRVVVHVVVDSLVDIGGKRWGLFAMSAVQSEHFRAAHEEAEQILETGAGAM